MLPGVRGLGVTARSLSLAGRPLQKGPTMHDGSIDPDQRTGNLLLDALGRDERALLLADAKRVPVEVGTVLFFPAEPVSYVPFPTSGTISMVAEPDETPVEAATIGREGAGALHSALGSRLASQQLVGQVKGEMITVGIDTFMEGIDRHGRLRDVAFGYIEALVVQVSLSAACNAVHHLNQRCARWLLQTHDRIDGDTFGLTQEYLGVMLGAGRPSVSIAQGTLKGAGCITFSRGSITIVDRDCLEAAACTCYEMIRLEYSRLVPLKSNN
jgi:CRP-like cAMP-binding protein